MAEDKNGFSVSREALEKLIQAHDGDLALLYLYLLQGGSPDKDSAALKLCRTGLEISAAFEKLERMKILPSQAVLTEKPTVTETPRPANVMPEYTVEDISSRTKTDSAWNAVKAEAEQIMGHILASNDIRVLYGAYDYLELNGEVLIILLHFLAEVYEEKYSGRKKPGAKAIETEAFRWHDAGIDSFEAAEAYITARKERAAMAGKIKAVLQINDRRLSTTEGKYLEAWIAMGMDEDAIELAYDRTVVNKGHLVWPYMDAILKRWNEKGLHSAEQIAQSEEAGRSGSKSGRTGNDSGITAQSDEELQKLIDII